MYVVDMNIPMPKTSTSHPRKWQSLLEGQAQRNGKSFPWSMYKCWHLVLTVSSIMFKPETVPPHGPHINTSQSLLLYIINCLSFWITWSAHMQLDPCFSVCSSVILQSPSFPQRDPVRLPGPRLTGHSSGPQVVLIVIHIRFYKYTESARSETKIDCKGNILSLSFHTWMLVHR